MIEEALEHFRDRVTEEMNESLQAEYKEEEIHFASQMHPIKGPWP